MLVVVFAIWMDKILSVSVAKVARAAVRAVTFAAGGPAARRWCDLQQDLPFIYENPFKDHGTVACHHRSLVLYLVLSP